MKSNTLETLGRTEITTWRWRFGFSFKRIRIYFDAKKIDWSTFWMMTCPGGLVIGGRPPSFIMNLLKIEGHPNEGHKWTKLPKEEFLDMVKNLRYRKGSK